MLLDFWCITSDVVVCCTLAGVWYVVGGSSIGAVGVGGGSGCMVLACVLGILGIFVSCSLSLSMRCGYVSWDSVGVSLTLDTRRNFTGVFLFVSYFMHISHGS